MIFTITGPTSGWTIPQEGMFRRYLHWLMTKDVSKPQDITMLNGVAWGVDLTTARIGFDWGLHVVAFPSNLLSAPARHHYAQWVHKIHPPAPPLKRNMTMVKLCEFLIGIPNPAQEIQRSGTWATIRYARHENKPHMLILPDGTLEPHNDPPTPKDGEV
jgi:hypothetical protein